jgi:hypothetical protein
MQSTPNLRWVAFKLGVRLIRASANPWSGLGHLIPHKEQPRSADQFSLPDWWPFDQPTGLSFDVRQLEAMRLASLAAKAHSGSGQTTQPLTQKDDGRLATD